MSSKTISTFVFVISAFLSMAASAKCIQPMVVTADELIAPAVFVGIGDQIMDPSAGRIASQAASLVNNRKTDASINQQVEYVHCVATASKRRQIIASITDSGTIFLQHGVLLNPDMGVAVNRP
jgi:hypothetical protein